MVWPAKCLRPQATLAPIRGAFRGRWLSTTSPNIATLLKTPLLHDHDRVEAVGWIRTVRKQKHVAFLALGDGSTTDTLQVVLHPGQATGLSTGAAVIVRGSWRPAPASAAQANELHAHDIVIQGPTDETYPIQKKYHSPEYLRNIPHLRLRTPLNAVLARLRSDADFFASEFFRRRQFVRLQPPIITSSDCEGAGEVFGVSTSAESDAGSAVPSTSHDHFFKSPKYLTVSSQLHLEAFVHEHPGVWALSPTFRAEKSDTPRHVSEFSMLEVEFRTESLDEVMSLVEGMVRDMVKQFDQSDKLADLEKARGKAIESDSGSQIPGLRARWDSFTGHPWPRISHAAALAELQAAERSGKISFARRPSENEGFHVEHERWLAEHVGQNGPVFVTDYPQATKPFYMLPSTEDANTIIPRAACFDLLLPEVCEIVGGSLREHRFEELRQAMDHAGINVGASPEGGPGNLGWYLDLRKYGSIPHGGFGLGLDRLLGFLAGVDNIKDVVQWPRYHGRCDC